jgi:2-polyprenyl-6-methoxyphenol hydroxylase-like FAD-dependent oxidoreductase
MYDVIVVGARVTGAPAAMLLARAGHRVLLVERYRVLDDTVSTHELYQPAIARLQEWGLLDRVLDTGCEPIRKLTVTRGGMALSGMPRSGAVDFALCPRRSALEKVLVQAAVEAGVEVRRGFHVWDILEEDGRVTGIRGRQCGGAMVEERARIVIGADGTDSLVAKVGRAEEYSVRPAQGCGYQACFSGVEMDGVEIHYLDGSIVSAFPIGDGQAGVAVTWPHHRCDEIRSDIAGHFMRSLAEVPALAARIGAGRRDTVFIGTGHRPDFLRQPYGPGWALAGDAGWHRDRVTGTGAMDAFCDAELVAEAVDAGLRGRRPLEAALADYESLRNERVAPLYEPTLHQMSFGPPPPEQAIVLRALSGNQEDTDRFLGLRSGVSSGSDFTAPENLGRMIGRTQRTRSALALERSLRNGFRERGGPKQCCPSLAVLDWCGGVVHAQRAEGPAVIGAASRLRG